MRITREEHYRRLEVAWALMLRGYVGARLARAMSKALGIEITDRRATKYQKRVRLEWKRQSAHEDLDWYRRRLLDLAERAIAAGEWNAATRYELLLSQTLGVMHGAEVSGSTVVILPGEIGADPAAGVVLDLPADAASVALSREFGEVPGDRSREARG